MVSGGPLRMTCHSKGLLSSTKPAEKPESVFLFRSAQSHHAAIRPRQARTADKNNEDKTSPTTHKRGPTEQEKNFRLDADIPSRVTPRSAT